MYFKRATVTGNCNPETIMQLVTNSRVTSALICYSTETRSLRGYLRFKKRLSLLKLSKELKLEVTRATQETYNWMKLALEARSEHVYVFGNSVLFELKAIRRQEPQLVLETQEEPIVI